MAESTDEKKFDPNADTADIVPPEKMMVDATPSAAIQDVVSSLVPPPAKSTRPKRGRPPKKKKPRSAKKTAKAGKAAAKAKKKRPRKKAKKAPKEKAVPKKAKRRPIPTSFINLFLFFLILAAFTGVQVLLRVSNKVNVPLTVEPIPITAEEDVKIEGSPEVHDGTDMTEAEAETMAEPSGESRGEDLKIPPYPPFSKGGIRLLPPSSKGGIRPENTVIAEAKPAEKEEPKKKIPRNTAPDIWKDDYTSGGPLDLDREDARIIYRKGNAILIQKKVPAAPTKTKPLQDEAYTDIDNPWNNGGTLDLDHPDNIIKNNADKTATRKNLQGRSEKRR